MKKLGHRPQGRKTRMLGSIVSRLASPAATSSSSLICKPNLSLSHHKYGMGAYWILAG